ncbi:hypothetical protein B0O99DRAFT_673254 [Bisporella sp. PMI_857]|nr:hypothetical protein B0O99DRAFT_673254 [Bisporella sp. PMI_857]
MKSVNRQFGKLVTKGEGNTAKVSVLLNDYENADKTLTKIIDASKAWRDAWVSILGVQLNTATAFEELYQPIIGTSDDHRDDPVLTPQHIIDRASSLKDTFAELKTELLQEVILMDTRVIQPATQAKDYLQPLRKSIKKRENKRLDWERYIDRVQHAQKKIKRTDRENASLAKAEEEMARAAEAFKVVDDHLRETLPPLIAAAFSILPHLLAVQIMIQNTLLAQYYTSMHNYAEDAGFASPPPPMEQVIETWTRDFKPTQQQVEGITVIARGKAVHQSMSLGDDGAKKTGAGLTARNGLMGRRTSSTNLAPNSAATTPGERVMRIPSNTSMLSVSRQDRSPSPAPSYQSSYSAHSNSGAGGDYFVAASQKKKPPPPPPKRINSTALHAVAQYAFDGQNAGDLSFKEGDRIRVVKKTDSTDDWWEGELRGVKGSFPANYCKLS